MAAFCHFWHMTPSDFWALTFREHEAMTDYAARFVKHRTK